MKRLFFIFVTALFCLAMTASTGVAATPLATASIEGVGSGVGVKIYRYESTTNVVAGGSTVFSIAVPKFHGHVIGGRFESSSTDCDVHLSESDSQGIKSTQTVWAMEQVNLGETSYPDSSPYFHNMDSPNELILYFTVAPDVLDTGNWVLILIISTL
jgi:hypothetical protein